MLDRAAATTSNRVASVVASLLQHKGVTRPLAADERLVDAGMTSMDMVNLMLAVETEFDLMIPADDITPANFRSVDAIAALVDRVLALI